VTSTSPRTLLGLLKHFTFARACQDCSHFLILGVAARVDIHLASFRQITTHNASTLIFIIMILLKNTFCCQTRGLYKHPPELVNTYLITRNSPAIVAPLRRGRKRHPFSRLGPLTRWLVDLFHAHRLGFFLISHLPSLCTLYKYMNFWSSPEQTIEHDIGPTKRFSADAFATYVALSRSQGWETIKLLRDFDDKSSWSILHNTFKLV
jgi:hypothetical protein